jgi:hypothetical protein
VATVEFYMRGGELRNALRAATRGAHERLHRHPGLAAIAKGTISRFDYCKVLTRLLGFHIPFELALGLLPERSVWLRADLQSLEGVQAQPCHYALTFRGSRITPSNWARAMSWRERPSEDGNSPDGWTCSWGMTDQRGVVISRDAERPEGLTGARSLENSPHSKPTQRRGIA